MTNRTGYFAVVGIALVIASGCDPQDVERAREKAQDARDAATQAAGKAEENIEPMIDRAAGKAKALYAEGKQVGHEMKVKVKEATTQTIERAKEIAEDAKPYVDKARKATTQAAERVKSATTQAVEKVKDAVGEENAD